MKLQNLRDPRLLKKTEKNDLSDIVAELSTASLLDKRPKLIKLANVLTEKLNAGQEDQVRAIFKSNGSPRYKQALLQALDFCVSSTDKTRPLQGLFFAIPVLIVSGGDKNEKFPAFLPEQFDLNQLFKQTGFFLNTKNVSFSNTLTSLDYLETVSWRDLMNCNQGLDMDVLGVNTFPAVDISLDTVLEKVHLRYLAGLSIASTKSPKFTETTADISKWGVKFTQQFDKYVNLKRYQIVAIPRRPVSIPRAIFDGIWALNEIGLQLFLSGTLRHCRQRIGEPDVTVATYSDNTVRIRFTSVFDDGFDRTFGWSLSGVDDFATVLDCIGDLLKDCGISNFEVMSEILN
ncbi:MAG: hypothetical protein CMK56_02965 [Proteobacteria bacterium]|nr:hypothetical protein [Pseudomonadota bacterium]